MGNWWEAGPKQSGRQRMSTNDRNTLDLLGEQAKDTQKSASDSTRFTQLRNYLRGLHSLALSEKGRAHVCHRFDVSDEELAAALAEQEARQGQPVHDLLHITTTALSGNASASGGAAKC